MFNMLAKIINKWGDLLKNRLKLTFKNISKTGGNTNLGVWSLKLSQKGKVTTRPYELDTHPKIFFNLAIIQAEYKSLPSPDINLPAKTLELNLPTKTLEWGNVKLIKHKNRLSTQHKDTIIKDGSVAGFKFSLPKGITINSMEAW